MISIYVESIGLIAPGLTEWAQAIPVLRGEVPYAWQEVSTTAPAILAAAERRRCIASARLALNTAHQALQQAPDASRQPACVFASSDGDSQVITQIMESLAQEAPDVSPTRFANSVHNAASGYWSIATGIMQGATCLSGYDDSFACGLLEAAAQAVEENIDCLLIASDVRFQQPFFALRPIAVDCAAALLLTPARSSKSMAKVQVALVERRAADCLPSWLPESFAGNPAARALPLLVALAAPDDQTIHLDYLEQSLSIMVSAC